jgi:Fanconi anemia group M protein
MKELKVIVDQRERNTELLDALEKHGLEVKFATLQIGDYIVSDRVCIERKTVSDFEGSLINGRLFEQIKRMKENYQMPLLIIEGDAEAFRLKRNVITGAIVFIYITYGLQILLSKDAEETASFIKIIATQEVKKEAREPTPKIARAYSDSQFKEFIIGNLPGVGPKISRALLRHFKNVKNIANASIEELMKVDKIGKKKAQRIHEILNVSYEET